MYTLLATVSVVLSLATLSGLETPTKHFSSVLVYTYDIVVLWEYVVYVSDFCMYVPNSLCTYTHMSCTQLCWLALMFCIMAYLEWNSKSYGKMATRLNSFAVDITTFILCALLWAFQMWNFHWEWVISNVNTTVCSKSVMGYDSLQVKFVET